MRADEYLVEEIIKLKQENENLRKELLISERDNETLSKNCDFLFKRFNELTSNLKKDFEIEFKGQSMNGKSFFVWYGDDNFEYYKDVFGFNEQQNVEEGEKENE